MLLEKYRMQERAKTCISNHMPPNKHASMLGASTGLLCCVVFFWGGGGRHPNQMPQQVLSMPNNTVAIMSRLPGCMEGCDILPGCMEGVTSSARQPQPCSGGDAVSAGRQSAPSNQHRAMRCGAVRHTAASKESGVVCGGRRQHVRKLLIEAQPAVQVGQPAAARPARHAKRL